MILVHPDWLTFKIFPTTLPKATTMKRQTVPKLGPPPKPSSAVVSKVMKSNRAKDTRLEVTMRKSLRKAGLKGLVLNPRNIVGRPDIAFPKKKVAVFVHGCFWHGCPRDYSLPKTHSSFWKRKIIRNKERDKRKRKELEKAGWKVFEFWEHEVKRNAFKCASRVRRYVESKAI